MTGRNPEGPVRVKRQPPEAWVTVNVLPIRFLLPLQPGVRQILEQAKHPIIIEGNYTGQLAGVIAEKLGIEIQDKILDYSGRPFTPELIMEKVKTFLN